MTVTTRDRDPHTLVTRGARRQTINQPAHHLLLLLHPRPNGIYVQQEGSQPQIPPGPCSSPVQVYSAPIVSILQTPSLARTGRQQQHSEEGQSLAGHLGINHSEREGRKEGTPGTRATKAGVQGQVHTGVSFMVVLLRHREHLHEDVTD